MYILANSCSLPFLSVIVNPSQGLSASQLNMSSCTPLTDIWWPIPPPPPQKKILDLRKITVASEKSRWTENSHYFPRNILLLLFCLNFNSLTLWIPGTAKKKKEAEIIFACRYQLSSANKLESGKIKIDLDGIDIIL